jgi:glutaconate CoA-transferase subunit B
MLLSAHPGIGAAQVQENTGFPLHIPDPLPVTPLPSERELEILRTEIDPKGIYLGAAA